MMYIIIILFLGLDLVSKYLIDKYLFVGESIEVINNFFSITYVKNTGAAWSIMSSNTWIVTVISILIIIGIIFYIYKYASKNKLEIVSLSMILGGALGNLIDRIMNGYVVDFLDFNLFGWDYPIFNLADTFIVIGVILYIIYTWRNKNGRN